jgi:magnesium-transporting ATPase (P-type)
MSVILRGPNGKIRLYCKGADSIVYDHLQSGNDDMKNKTQEHLNVSESFIYCDHI